MGFELTIQGLRQIGWPGTPGRDSANPKSGERRPRAFNPAGAETPEEALAYIKLLYKAGRTDQLAELLRHSPVFREAWQTLQQFSASGSEADGLPAPPAGGPNGQVQNQGQGLAAPEVTATPGSSPGIPAAQNYPLPASRPTRLLAAARRVYETQARYYAQERANLPRISLRV